MNKIFAIVLGALSPILGAVGTKLYLDRKTRREAEEARPKIEALLDEMIRIAVSHTGPMDKIVGMNTRKIVNDEKRDRDLTLHAGDTIYSLDVSTKLIGKKSGRVCVRIYRSRGDASLHVYWPGVVEYRPMEPWLQERLERLDALVGTASRWDGIKRRFPDLDDDKGPSNTN